MIHFCLLLKYYFSGLAFVTKLAVREDFLVDNVDVSLKSKDVECASNVDDKECRVSLDMDVSDTDNGMRQRFFLSLSWSIDFALLSCNVTHIITDMS